MTRIQVVVFSAVLAALLPITACSSNGRVAFNGGLGGGGGGGGGDPVDPPPPPPPPGPGPGSCCSLEPIVDGTQTVVVTVGNLVGEVLPNGTGLEGLDPLGRVVVGNQTLVGEANGTGVTAIGLNVGSDAQPQGELATLGVLTNGQIIATNTLGPSGGGDLIGATLTGNQIIGQGKSQEIGVGVLSPTPTAGNTLGVNVLRGGQVVDVAIGGQSLTSGLTGTVTGILTGQGPTTTIGGVLTGEGGVIIGGGG
jgi:fibronectin-binding autotransporter adhesin